MKERSIALIGFRATGKSLVGKLLSQRLAMDFVDMDEELVAVLGRDIQSWVSAHGWNSFREAESQLLDTLAKRKRVVLATGGGVVLKPSNREILGRNFLVVWLQASPETIHERLSQDPKTSSQRPPLTDLSLQDEIDRVLLERHPLYEATADLILDTDTVSPPELARQIQAFLESRSTP